VGLELGYKIGAFAIQKVRIDGADGEFLAGEHRK
jgi:hypothetical protein